MVVEQIIRPTGLVDPEVEVRPVGTQVDDLLDEIRKRAEAGERVLVTTLTKRMAEDLTEYYTDVGVRCRYLHSDIETLERSAIIRDLRRGEFDVLVGINLLREGLDIPEVSLVAILDADKEGFLRSEVSLIQTIGRAARNVNGRVILYADSVTESMQPAPSTRPTGAGRSSGATTRRTGSPRRRVKQQHPRPLHGGLRGRLRHRARSAATGPSTSPSRSRPWWPSWRRRCGGPPRRWSSRRPPQLRDRILALKDLELGVRRNTTGCEGMLGSGAMAGAFATGPAARRPQRRKRR